MNNVEFGYHIEKMHVELERLLKAFDSSDLKKCYDIIIFGNSIWNSLAKFCIPQEKVMLNFPDLIISEINGEDVITHKEFTFTRAQAIDIRNQLANSGLRNFKVAYEGNGYIYYSDISFNDNEDVLFRLKKDFPEWNIKRSINDDNLYFLRNLNIEIPIDIAQSFANQLFSRFPFATIRVYYGDNKSTLYVTGKIDHISFGGGKNYNPGEM